MKRYLVLQQYVDVFLADILSLPPQREVYFSIELVPTVEITSKAPYRMKTPKLFELNL